MNRQTQNRPGSAPQPRANGTPPPANRRHGPDPRAESLLRRSMIAVGVLIFALGLLLVILPTFRVGKIVVEGIVPGSRLTEADVISASGIQKGDELFGLSSTLYQDIAKNLNGKAELTAVYVEIKFPSTVVIRVEEKAGGSYTAFNGGYISFDENFTVVRQSRNPADFAGELYVSLPPISSLSVGGPIRFLGDPDMSYVGNLIAELKENGVLNAVTSMNLSGKYNVSFVLNGICRIEIGEVRDVTSKLETAGQILSVRGGIGESCVVIDVTNLKKPTFREVDSVETVLKNPG